MKKLFMLLLILIIGSVITLAQDDYYYTGGRKVYLIKDPTRKVSITSKSDITVAYPSVGETYIQTITDECVVLNVYEESLTIAPIIPTSTVIGTPVSNVSRQACYVDSDSQLMIPDGYIMVKLKKSSDYALLESTASQYNCVIHKQNASMPLWYILRMLPGTGRNSVVIANSIYETGRFASSSPSFTYDASAQM